MYAKNLNRLRKNSKKTLIKLKQTMKSLAESSIIVRSILEESSTSKNLKDRDKKKVKKNFTEMS